jgi:hypothetical protein
LREQMLSFAYTLRRGNSTVRGLMNSCAPISGFVCLSTRPARNLRLLRGQHVEALHAALADLLAGGQVFNTGTLRERLGTHVGAHVASCAPAGARAP